MTAKVLERCHGSPVVVLCTFRKLVVTNELGYTCALRRVVLTAGSSCDSRLIRQLREADSSVGPARSSSVILA